MIVNRSEALATEGLLWVCMTGLFGYNGRGPVTTGPPFTTSEFGRSSVGVVCVIVKNISAHSKTVWIYVYKAVVDHSEYRDRMDYAFRALVSITN